MSMIASQTYEPMKKLKAIFAYLRTIKPIKNNSVPPTPPALARKTIIWVFIRFAYR
jgi:hypothetical protein